MPLDQAILDALKLCCKDADVFEQVRTLFESQVAKSDEIEAMLQHTIDNELERFEQEGIYKIFRKPFDPKQFLAAIASALASRKQGQKRCA